MELVRVSQSEIEKCLCLRLENSGFYYQIQWHFMMASIATKGWFFIKNDYCVWPTLS